jgi:hypothetical protein
VVKIIHLFGKSIGICPLRTLDDDTFIGIHLEAVVTRFRAS